MAKSEKRDGKGVSELLAMYFQSNRQAVLFNGLLTEHE